MAEGRHHRDHETDPEDGIYVPPSRATADRPSPWAPPPPSAAPAIDGDWTEADETDWPPEPTPPSAAPQPPVTRSAVPQPSPSPMTRSAGPSGTASTAPQSPPVIPEAAPRATPRRVPTLRNSDLGQRSSDTFPRRVDPYTGEPNPYAPPPDFRVPAQGSGPPTPPPPRPERSNARSWWLAIGAVIVAIGIAAGILLGLNFAHRSGSSGAGATCGGHPVLRVAVAPDFAPVVRQAARDLGGSAGCQVVTVSAQEPADTLTGLAGAPIDAWIPSSSSWLRQTGAAPTARASPAPSLAGSPVSLARSPIVVAVPKAFADSIGWPAKQPGWAELTTMVTSRQLPRFSMGDPQRDTAAMLSVLGVQAAMARTTPDPGIAQMRGLTLRARLADPAADTTALLRRMGSQTDAAAALKDVGAFPITEQQAWAYDQTAHKVPIAALYPADGLLEADYPLVLTARTAGDQARGAIAARLTDRIRSTEFTPTLTAAGFRPAAQSASASAAAPSGDGLLAQYPAPGTLPASVGDSTRVWARYKRLAYQTLLLVDGSASMNDAV
jgi:Ca-activated chloride channel family protein